ncbi:Nuclear cap-binding protein subunit 2 [Gurleya vavrai]
MEKYVEERKGSIYRDKNQTFTDEEYKFRMENSCTLYVGEINFKVKEERLWELFSLVGTIKRIIMGVNRQTLNPCGFCFVEFYCRKDAQNAITLFNGFRFDNKHLNVSIDYGFLEGREFGRGSRGGQIKDDRRNVKRFCKRNNY